MKHLKTFEIYNNGNKYTRNCKNCKRAFTPDTKTLLPVKKDCEYYILKADSCKMWVSY